MVEPTQSSWRTYRWRILFWLLVLPVIVVSACDLLVAFRVRQANLQRTAEPN